MKKRERILVQILLCVALFAGVWIFFLDPALTKKSELKDTQQIVAQKREAMDALISSKTLEEEKEKEVKRAEENYEFFYSVLNSYSIDEILNGLAADNGLNIQSLQISDYEDGSDDFDTNNEVDIGVTETEESEPAETMQSADKAKVLKCSADLTVTGNYENILSFIDAMNAKSSCLKTTNFSLSQNQRGVSDSYSNIAQIQIEIYGINTIEEK